MPRLRQCARAPVVVYIGLDEVPMIDTILSRMQDIARDVHKVTLCRSGLHVADRFVARILSSWPCTTRLQIRALRLPSSEDAVTLEGLTVFHYRHDISDDSSSNLVRMLHSMPSLEELKVIADAGELPDSVKPPPCRLRSYSYHTKYPPAALWHFPILNSIGCLKQLSLLLVDAPPAASVLAAADIIGASLEVLSLRGSMSSLPVAVILLPRCVRLREVTIGIRITDDNVQTVVDLIAVQPRALLRKLPFPMPPVLASLLGTVLEAGIPPPLRALREIHPFHPGPVDRTITTGDISGLVRVCTTRSIRFDFQRLLSE
ncbi:hypothetical protein AURDEDRAFT_174301 [Auricularia subglabra TFB-10046 SS5]|nr:hypothetical protein AURDEDRAFT_174301 [Auricularia subglabra TFB-10046 SS5]